MKFELIRYTMEIMDALEKQNLYITHLNIAYKVINFYESNVHKITPMDYAYLNQIILEIYDMYTQNDDADELDRIIENLLKK